MPRIRTLLLTAVCLATQKIIAIEAPTGLSDFLDAHCLACHNADDKNGNLDLSSLKSDFKSRDISSRWVKIHDRVNSGEMPPADEPRPDAHELQNFVTSLATALSESEQASYLRDGRAGLRRLNRYEYENTIRDLLNVPWVEIKEKLPEDGEAHRFNKTGRALDVSHVQMARFLSSSEYALLEAMAAVWNRPDSTTQRYYARDERSMTGNFRPRENSTLPDRLSFPVLDSAAQPDVRAGRAPMTTPDTREREAVGRVSSIFSDAGGYRWEMFRAPVAGRYRLRFKGYTIWVSGGGMSRWYYEGFGNEKAPVYYLPLWHRPNLDEVWRGRGNEPMSVFAQSAGQNRMLGEFDFTPEPGEREMTVMLKDGDVVSTDGSRLFRARVNGTGEQYINPLATEHGMPGYAIQWMDVEGPLPDVAVDAGYRLMFGELKMKSVNSDKPGVALIPTQLSAGGGPRGKRGPSGRDGPALGGFAPPSPICIEV